MSDVLYPTLRGLAFNVLVRDEYNTLIQKATNGYETRVSLMQNPIHHWELIYDVLPDRPGQVFSPNLLTTDFRTLRGFYNARKGDYDDFLFLDPDDNAVVDGVLPLVQDNNGVWYSPIQRALGEAYEDVTDLNGGITVKAAGNVTTNYVLSGPGLAVPGQSFQGLYLVWAAQPQAPITATFNFYFRVRFEMNAQDFEKFVSGLWTVGGSEGSGSSAIKLMSARRAPQV